jgi:hypothetical protein
MSLMITKMQILGANRYADEMMLEFGLGSPSLCLVKMQDCKWGISRNQGASMARLGQIIDGLVLLLALLLLGDPPIS